MQMYKQVEVEKMTNAKQEKNVQVCQVLVKIVFYKN